MNDIVTVDRKDIQNTQPTFTEGLFERFIKYVDVKETTMTGYIACLRQFIKWLHDEQITQPTREDIRAYKKHLEGKKYSAGTQSQYLRSVKQFFRWTGSEGLYPNIADNIKGAKVKQDNSKKEAFRELDIKAILDSIDRTEETGKRDYCMILLSVTGALRIIEMQRANIEDIQTIAGQKVLYIQGKGHCSKDDYIKIVPELMEALEDYLHCRNWKKTDPLFTGTSNRAKYSRLSEPSISRIIKARFKEAGFDCSKLTAHSLRHTSNTVLFKAGADLYTVQHHARHQDPKTTEIYIHAAEKEQDRSEQIIYNRIFKPEEIKEDPVKEITTILQTLPLQDQEEILKKLKTKYATGTQLQAVI